MVARNPENRLSIFKAIEMIEQVDLNNQNNEVNLQSKSSFFFKKTQSPSSDKAQNKRSCFPKEIVNDITNLISKLEKEIESIWPYPNKERKQAKLIALQELLAYSKEKNANATSVIQRIKRDYNSPDLFAGKNSHMTRLFEKIEQLIEVKNESQFIEAVNKV